MRRLVATSWMMAALLLAVGPAAAAPLKVVASFTVLADLAREVGGDQVEVTSLAGPDSDAHGFEPTVRDVRRVADADLVVVNGLGLDVWAERLATSAGNRQPLLVAGTSVTPRMFPGGGVDPHAWQSVANAKKYATAITEALALRAPDRAALFRAGLARYLAVLDQLDAEIRAAYAPIPAERRIAVTTHQSFGYYAAAYGLTILAPQGLSTEAEPSARTVVALIRQIREDKVRAVFLENMASPKLIEQVARETGVTIGGSLYSDALSAAGGKAPSYVEMLRSNTKTIVAALR